MTHEPEQVPDSAILDQLAAADPAAELTVPTDQLWAAVGAKIQRDEAALTEAGEGEAGRPGDAAIGADGPVSLAQRRRKRPGPRRLLLPIAAAVAGVLVVGAASFGAGAFAGARGLLDSVLAPAGVPAGGSGSPTAQPAQTATPSPSTSGAGSDEPGGDTPAGGGYGGAEGGTAPSEFTAGDLGSGPASGQAYRLDAASAATADRLAQVAGVFGLTGTVRQGTNQFELRAPGTGGAVATLQTDPSTEAGFAYCNPGNGAQDCSTGARRDPDLGAAPSGAAAVNQVRDLLARIWPEEQFQIEADPVDPGQSQYQPVTATRWRDGHQVGAEWSVIITSRGVAEAAGPLAEISALGAYQLITPNEAVERLNDPRFASRTLSAYGKVSDIGDTSLTDSADPMQPGSPLPWPVNEVTITSASLELGPLTVADGSEIAVPVYLLGTSDGRSWAALAVADGELAFDVGTSPPAG